MKGAHQMFDHVCLEVSDMNRSRTFYDGVLKHLGFRIWAEGTDYVGYGTNERPHFWLNLSDSKQSTERVHIAFPAESRAQVDSFYKLSLELGARSEGVPGLRPEYHPHYYGAFVLDPDGNNIEAVFHKEVR
jgi:catechol 2,3-dioxygenase-like lactoylglutathione lyase family enzyme